jgi:hypothetical protein
LFVFSAENHWKSLVNRAFSDSETMHVLSGEDCRNQGRAAAFRGLPRLEKFASKQAKPPTADQAQKQKAMFWAGNESEIDFLDDQRNLPLLSFQSIKYCLGILVLVEN